MKKDLEVPENNYYEISRISYTPINNIEVRILVQFDFKNEKERDEVMKHIEDTKDDLIFSIINPREWSDE